jgi:hypothetical protein
MLCKLPDFDSNMAYIGSKTTKSTKSGIMKKKCNYRENRENKTSLNLTIQWPFVSLIIIPDDWSYK